MIELPEDPTTRRMIAFGTIGAMAVATLVMAIWGFNSLTAPFAKDTSSVSSSTGDSCSSKKSVVQRSAVTVSVYNAGKKSGRARSTLNLLEAAGFKPGAVGNAPKGSKVPRVQVRTTLANDPAAKLVARSFGKNTPVTVSPDDLGPGIDVFIGDNFTKLDPNAATSITVPASTIC